MLRNLLALLLPALLLSSCSTDFEINAPYKQTTAIHSLLNQSEPVQYVRVNRSFLGKGNAFDMAKIKDSVYFSSGEIKVQIKKFENNVEKGSIDLSETKINLEEGTFFKDSVPVYKTSGADQAFFVPGFEYRVVVTNNKTGKVTSGKTFLMEHPTDKTRAPLEIVSPKPQYPYVSFKKVDGNYNDYMVEWNSAKFGRVYGLSLKFYYVEYNTSGFVKDTSFIEMKQPEQNASSLNGGVKMTQKILGKTFFEIIRDSLKVRDARDGNTTLRKADTSNVWVQFSFAVGNDDLNTFINVNKPSTGIVQERPLFTNIENGIGLVASRYYISINKKLEIVTETELKNGITREYFD